MSVNRDTDWPKVRLIDNGPEFEMVPPSPPPTYEQAIVHMYREAESIIAQGHALHSAMEQARLLYLKRSSYLRKDRKALGLAKKHARWQEVVAELFPRDLRFWQQNVKARTEDVCTALDNLWEAQEKYKAWAALYGDI